MRRAVGVAEERRPLSRSVGIASCTKFPISSSLWAPEAIAGSEKILTQSCSLLITHGPGFEKVRLTSALGGLLPVTAAHSHLADAANVFTTRKTYMRESSH
jgi:hypothetical protein